VDAYSASVGFFCSLIVMMVVSNLRAREGVTKYFYIRVGAVDSLTQVMSRREFESQAKGFFAARQPEDSSCALLMLDIDRFKSINDEYGHQVGDEVLAKVGSALNGCFRRQDLVGRIGGDEFMVLVLSLKESDDLKEIAERIRKSFAEIRCLPDQQTITASIGIAIPKGMQTYEEMYRSADQAMYQAKTARTGYCEIISESEH
jgi:diguanylate cyclase (GGDEF)-like protein